MSDYYTLLGVDRHTSQEALRRAYRSHILAMHPDHNPGDDLACDRAREIIEAYHTLSNPWSKRDYDISIGYVPAYITTRATSRNEPVTFQWLPRLMLIFAFFAVVAGLVYGTMFAIGSRNVVFRPQMDVVSVSRDPASPAIMGRRIARANTDVAREARDLASNIVSRICVETAFYSQNNGRCGIRLLADAAPVSN